MKLIDQPITFALAKLDKSKFRSKFKLSKNLMQYSKEKGYDALRNHARDILSQRLFIKHPKNDGKQTPYKGHPVFVAQHGTATCCRTCLEKWYKIPKDTYIEKPEQEFIIDLIVEWIKFKCDK